MKRIFFAMAALAAIFGCSGGNPAVQAFRREVIDSKGHLFIIGGGARSDSMMQRMVDLAGEGDKHVLIVPFASGEAEMTGAFQREQFLRLGVNSCKVMFCHKDSVDSPGNLALLDGVNIVFFSGGDQNVLTSYLSGTAVLQKIREIYREGGVVGGTSAGAAVMSKVMITGKEKNKLVPEESFVFIGRDNIETAEGFGFLENIVVDQHFLYRKRQNRLFSVLLDNPGLRGVGIDEATAIVVKPDNSFEVVGESDVLVFEPLDMPEGSGSPAFTVRILSPGDSYVF